MATFTVDLLTGNIFLFNGDFSGSGSTPIISGSTYPQVSFYNNLPAAGTVSGKIYVVRNGTAGNVLSRKSSGFYFSTGAVWRFLGDTPEYFKSDTFLVYDNVDNTKGLSFVTSGVTGGVFRKLKIQNSDGTIAYLTDLNTKVDVSVFNNYTGITTPATYVNKVDFNGYTGTTLLLIQGKQNALIAGTGISIAGNVISTTGTSLTAGLQQVTNVNAVTTIESTFNGGLKTNHIRPTGDTTTAFQIRKASGTPIINVDTVSGFTGHGTITPKGLVHAFGIDNSDKSLIGTESNAFIIDGNANVDKDIQWAEHGVPKWLAETYRNENAKFWYLYNVEANNSPLTISESGRVGINNQTNIIDYHVLKIQGTGTGLLISGLFNKNFIIVYQVKINSVSGTTDTYVWRESLNYGITYGNWSASSVITTAPILFSNGIYLEFERKTGNILNDTWEFAGFPQLPIGTFIITATGFQEIQRTNNYTASTIIYEDVTGILSSSSYGQILLNIGTTLNAFYVGSPIRYDSLFINILTGATNATLITEYWTGSAWIDISVGDPYYQDNTNNLNKTGEIIWNSTILTNWIKSNMYDLPTDENELYWMRFTTSSPSSTKFIANSLVKGGNVRFGVNTSPQSYHPKFYIDSLGRANIGGGNIVGTNVLQINTSCVVQTPTPVNSLVEIDSENSDISDLKIKLASNNSCSTGIRIVKARGNLLSSTGMETGDELGHLTYRGFVGIDSRNLADLSAQYTGNGLTRTADFIIKIANGSDPIEQVRITSSGTTGFGITPTAVVTLKAGSTTIAPLKFTSGNLLTSPQVGAMEFLGNNFYATTTGNTRKTFAFLEGSHFTGNIAFESGTTFNDGFATPEFRPLGDCATAIQITNAADNKVFININTLSGFTGFGTCAPKSLVHLYGTDNTLDDGWNYQTNSIRVDGNFNADKDIQWFSEGQPKFSAKIFRCEDGCFWYLSSPQAHINQLTISETGRVGINNQTNIMDYHAILEAGGPNDINIGGIYSQNYSTVYQIQISGISGTTDMFKWRKSIDDGDTFNAWSLSVELSNTPYELEYGVTVYWTTITGHTFGTLWIFGAFPQLPIGTFIITPNKFDEVQQTFDYSKTTIMYNDITGRANNSTFGSPIIIFNTGTTTNATYFGMISKINSITFNANTFGAGVTLITEYWNGNIWIALNSTNHAYYDDTNNLAQSGALTWEITSMAGWIRADIPNLLLNHQPLYWIRIRTSTVPTIVPIANSFAMGGKYRLAVLTSSHDFKPSMYVDGLGRTNIGGGNISGTNLFQINKEKNIQVAVNASKSLAEIDSEDSCIANLKIKLSSNDSVGAGLVFAKTRGTLGANLNICTGDAVGSIDYRATINGVGGLLSQIRSQYTGDGVTIKSDIIFGTSCGTYSDKVRITSSGTTGFGIAPTAVISLKAGSTTIAPLKFTSGSLLTSPQVGAVEFLTDAYYGTISSGNARRTFAFLESPQFTGNPNLPVSTCLNSSNLCTYILQSGGTNNDKLYKTCNFNIYTGNTQSIINTAITGVTNGLTKSTCHNVKLGGALTETTVVGNGAFDFTICSKHLKLGSRNGIDILAYCGNNIDIYSSGGTTSIKGMTTGGTEAMNFQISNTQATFIDSRAIPFGVEYNGNYSSTFTARSLVDKAYVDSHTGGGVIVKQAVTVSTTAPITMSGLTIIGSVQLTTGMRVLVKNQASTPTNGVYSASTGTWGRVSDFDQTSEIVTGSYFYVNSGTTNAKTAWVMNAPQPVVVGVSAITFTIFSSQVGVTQGNGICVTQTGGNYSVAVKLPTNCGLCADNSGTYINPNIGGTGICYGSGTLCVYGAGLAGNSISWTGNTFNVNPATGTLSTVLNSKLNVSTFCSYTGVTQGTINNKLNTSIFTTYTGTTAPTQFVSKSAFTTYTGTTVPATYVTKSAYNNYTGATKTTLDKKAYLSGATFTGNIFVCTPIANDNSNCAINSAWYISKCASVTPTMNGSGTIGSSTCWAHSDHIHPSDTSRLTVDAFNGYTGNTASAIGLKANIASPTFTTSAFAPKPTVDNNSTCIATTSWYFGQSGTTAPVMDGAGVIGTSLRWAHADHVHPRDTSKASLSGATFTGAVAGLTCAVDTCSTAMATTAFVVGQASITSPLMDGNVAIGSCLTYARANHIHPTDTSRASCTNFTTFTGTTAPAAYASKVNAITGATNLGSGNVIYTSVSANKVQLKSISGGTGISISNTGTQINVCSTISQFNWSGTTANGVGTYVSASCIKSNPNMTFNGTALSITGNINASTYVCSPIITGSTKVCSPSIIGTTTVCGLKIYENGTCLGSTYYPYTQIITGRTTTTSVDATYANKIIEANGTFTITFPNGMATGMMVDVVNVGTGAITLAASTTINAKNNNLRITTQWAGASVYHRGSNVWVAVGNLVA